MRRNPETDRNRRRRDVIALVIHDVHCTQGCAASDECEGVDEDDLARAADLIEALDRIDAELGYSPTCSTCGVTVYWTADEPGGMFHTDVDAAYRSGPGPHAVTLRGPDSGSSPSGGEA